MNFNDLNRLFGFVIACFRSCSGEHHGKAGTGGSILKKIQKVSRYLGLFEKL